MGAYLEDEDASGGATAANAGSAYIFKQTAGVWAQQQKIVASDRAASDNFGYSVAISGDYAIVGAYLEDENARRCHCCQCRFGLYFFAPAAAPGRSSKK
ncbi:MAG: FG-GAP repeat protein [Bacteroidetes bacterium]|nr:FG-GAP repeat protein [Bacteroidota bacterium]